jgi:hypothetical protein
MRIVVNKKSKKMLGKTWWPEICYFEPSQVDEEASMFPFIDVPAEEKMPAMLFIMEKRDTNEFEPGPQGEDLPVSSLNLINYGNLVYLKENISAEIYSQVVEVLRKGNK